jgi:superfamily II DNA or RNA helicase
VADVITISKLNDVFVRVECDPSISYELSEYFTFNVPGAKFTPAYRNKVWDGKIRLFNMMKRTLYGGLASYINKFAEERGYDVGYNNSADFNDTEFDQHSAHEFIKSLGLPFQPRDYQIEAFVHAIQKRRSLLLSPTASGKSFIIYLITKYLLDQGRVLIVVPVISLVHQMYSDFVEYGCDPSLLHKIHDGKDTKAHIVISTWQSIYNLPRTWFNQFSIVIGDEAHLFKAKSLTSLLEKMTDCPYRFGFTGTLDGTQTHKLVLEGMFGAVHKVTTTAELIEQKHLAEFKIKSIVLSYEDEARKLCKTYTYQEEVKFLLRHMSRNKFISKLASLQKSNTLVLFQIREHGKILFKQIEQLCPDRKVFFVDGEVSGTVREDIRMFTEKNDDVIIVASYGTFSTGVNIKNLHAIVFASPSKSRIRNLQSIGRGLRRSATKTSAVLYDVADDLSWKSHKNFTMQHFAERVKIYNEEKFEYNIFSVDIKGVA